MGLLRQTELAKLKFLLLDRTAFGGHDYVEVEKQAGFGEGFGIRMERNIHRRGLLRAEPEGQGLYILTKRGYTLRERGSIIILRVLTKRGYNNYYVHEEGGIYYALRAEGMYI